MAGIPTTIRALSATSQSAPAGSAVGEPPSVIVEDVDRVPVGGQAVSLSVTGGGGSISPASLQTDVNGIATATSWILGATVGTNTAQMSVAGLAGDPVGFTAEGTPPPAASIEANSVTSQGGTVGTAVAAPPSVLVKDTVGAGKAGITVLISVLSGGGQISETSLVTGGTGVATLGSWILGTTAGAQSVQMSVAGLTGDPIVFNATAAAGAVAALVAVSTVSQTGQISTAVADPPAVRAQDSFGNPKSGASVAFAATVGGGSVGATPVVTGADGVASSGSWTLGGSAGDNELTATVTAIPAVTFVATAQNPPTTMAAASATSQNAGTSTNVADPPAVLITGSGGVPSEGVAVDFAVTAGGGSINTTQVLTGPDGIARLGRWTVGSVAGANTVTATVTGLTGSPQSFSATGLALTATTLEAASATSQNVVVSTTVTDRPAVRVRAASGLVVAGVPVTFAVTAGGGSILPATAVNTDADGIARATSWTADATVGTDVNQATATASGLTGSPITFRASGVPGPAASMTAASAVSQTGAVGTAVESPPAVTIRDSAGNLIPGHAVTFTRTQGVNGSISPSSPAVVLADASGIAALSRWSLGTNPGVDTDEVVASSSGLTSVVFRASAQAGGGIPVPAGPRARVERLELATDLACLGGVVIGDILGVVEARIDHRFEGLVRIRRLTVRFLRRAWPGVSELRAGRVIRVMRRDGDFDEFRVESLTLASGGDGLATVEARDPILDFGDRSGLLTTVTAGVPALSVTAQRRTIANLLAEVLVPNATPAQWGLGVTPAGAVDATFDKATSLAALVAAVTQINETTAQAHEISARRNGVSNYLIDVAVVGAAAPVPDVRTGKNLLGIEITRDPAEQATRLYPVDGSGRTLDDNAWLVTAVAAGVSIDVASIEGGSGPSLEAGQLTGFGWEDAAGTVHPVTGSTVVSDTTTRLLMASTTGIAVNDWGRLTADSAGTGVSFVELPSLVASQGRIAKELPATVPHVTNWVRNPLFADSADGVNPDGWGVLPANTAWVGTQGFGGSRSIQFTSAVSNDVTQSRTVRVRAAGTLTYSVFYRLASGGGGVAFRTRDPETGTLDGLFPVLTSAPAWRRLDVSYAVTAGTKSLTVALANQTATAGQLFFGGALIVLSASAEPFVAGSAAATSWQRALARLQTHGTPLVTVKGSIADLTGHDPSSWPDDQLHHGGLVDVTDEELGEVFSARLVALTEDLLNPAQSVPTLATQPRLLSTLIGSTP